MSDILSDKVEKCKRRMSALSECELTYFALKVNLRKKFKTQCQMEVASVSGGW